MFGLTHLLSARWPEVVTFLMVLGRTGGLMVSAPFWGGRVVPGLIKIVFSAGISVAIYPLVKTVALPAGDMAGASSLIALLLMMGGEILVGVALGWAAQILFSGMRLAGQQMETRMGLSLASLIDPQAGAPSALFSVLLDLLATLIFLALNGHHLWIRALASSYALFPLAGAKRGLVSGLVSAAAGVFTIGLQVSAPVMVGLVLSDIVLGIVNRLIPQMNVFVVALPLQFLFGMLLLLFSLPVIGWFFMDRLADLSSGIPGLGAAVAGRR